MQGRLALGAIVAALALACGGREFGAALDSDDVDAGSVVVGATAGGAGAGGAASEGGSAGVGGSALEQGGAAGAGGEPVAVCTVPPRETWGVSASSTCQTSCAALPGAPFVPEKAIDGDAVSRWTTAGSQNPELSGDWLRVDFGRVVEFSRVRVDTTPSPDDAPAWLEVFAGEAPDLERAELFAGEGATVLDLEVPGARGRFLWLEQSGGDNVHHWSVYELEVSCD